MARYSVAMTVPDELKEDTAACEAANFEGMLLRHVTGCGLTPVGEMTYSWHEHPLFTVDPYGWLPWWQRMAVALRLRKRPQPYTVKNWTLRGIVEVSEEPQ